MALQCKAGSFIANTSTGDQPITGVGFTPKAIRFYAVPQASDVDGNPGTTLIELRSTGQQTVIPPSVHPSGELLVWADKRDPARCC